MSDQVTEEVVEQEVDQTEETSYDVRTFPPEIHGDPGELFAALAKAQGEITNGAKDRAAHNYKYMELDQLIDNTREALAKNELAVWQSHELVQRNKPAVVTHTFVGHPSGAWIRMSLEIPVGPNTGQKLTPAQRIGVVATYGRRYSLQALCKVAAEKDTDGVNK